MKDAKSSYALYHFNSTAGDKADEIEIGSPPTERSIVPKK
jgi:hypothetical protein